MKCPHCHKTFETDPIADYNKHIRATEKKIKKLVQAEFPGKDIMVHFEAMYYVTMWMEDDESVPERLSDFCKSIETPSMQLYAMVNNTEWTKMFAPTIYRRKKK